MIVAPYPIESMDGIFTYRCDTKKKWQTNIDFEIYDDLEKADFEVTSVFQSYRW